MKHNFKFREGASQVFLSEIGEEKKEGSERDEESVSRDSACLQ